MLIRATPLRAFVVALLMMTALPVRAHTAPGRHVVWEALLPCAPFSCGSGYDGYFTPCEAPYPPGSYDDVVTTPAPAAPPGKVTVLQATVDPLMDWDLFICANNWSRTELASGAIDLGGPCDTVLGPNTSTFFGCHEDTSTLVTAGQTYILRAYNWLDIPTATGRYWFTFV